MAKRRKMKLSEARIICYLDVANTINSFVRKIANKLDTDYGYITKILTGMVEKNWLKSKRVGSKVFYSLTSRTPIDTAKDINSQ